MPRARLNRQHLTINVSPETAETLRRLAYEQRTSRGDIVDAAIKELVTHPRPTDGPREEK